jgi:hypothetical protein
VNGVMVISLDYELFWGVRDKRTINSYFENLNGVDCAIDLMLNLFSKEEIEVTWAVVGMLFLDNIETLKESISIVNPAYKDKNLSPFNYIQTYSGRDEKFHFASGVIDKINTTKGQYIGSHTFSHYYCKEEGANDRDFSNDLKMAVKIAQRSGIVLKSLVFPRNQIDDSLLYLLKNNNIESYRGNQKGWMYKTSVSNESLIKRLIRLFDHYVNISGSNTFDLDFLSPNSVNNIPASSFFRPYSSIFPFLEWLKIRRIKRSMTFAAKNGRGYHLWWHPHNFGMNTKENMRNLREIVNHFLFLKQKYGMTSLSMESLSNKIKTSRK